VKRLKVEITVLTEEFTGEEILRYAVMTEEVDENIRQTLIEEVFGGQEVSVKSSVIEEESQ
jgi:hypothetical protein